jgi:hypothetical protein
MLAGAFAIRPSPGQGDHRRHLTAEQKRELIICFV